MTRQTKLCFCFYFSAVGWPFSDSANIIEQRSRITHLITSKTTLIKLLDIIFEFRENMESIFSIGFWLRGGIVSYYLKTPKPFYLINK